MISELDPPVDIYLDSRTIMHTPKVSTCNISDNIAHFGLMNGLINKLNFENFDFIKKLSLVAIQIHIDGVPVYHSESKKTFWPVLCRVVNINNKQPFVVSIFYGDSKPNDINDLIGNFIGEYNNLLLNGLPDQQTEIGPRSFGLGVR